MPTCDVGDANSAQDMLVTPVLQCGVGHFDNSE